MKYNGFVEMAEHFAYLFPKGREWFSPKEAGELIGRSDQFVRNSFYSGKIFGHLSNGLAKRGEEKKHICASIKTRLFYICWNLPTIPPSLLCRAWSPSY